jgi:hypothetical protein
MNHIKARHTTSKDTGNHPRKPMDQFFFYLEKLDSLLDSLQISDGESLRVFVIEPRGGYGSDKELRLKEEQR